jgi:hypothetical protein
MDTHKFTPSSHIPCISTNIRCSHLAHCTHLTIIRETLFHTISGCTFTHTTFILHYNFTTEKIHVWIIHILMTWCWLWWCYILPASHCRRMIFIAYVYCSLFANRKGKNAWEIPSLNTYLTSIMTSEKTTLVKRTFFICMEFIQFNFICFYLIL